MSLQPAPRENAFIHISCNRGSSCWKLSQVCSQEAGKRYNALTTQRCPVALYDVYVDVNLAAGEELGLDDRGEALGEGCDGFTDAPVAPTLAISHTFSFPPVHSREWCNTAQRTRTHLFVRCARLI